MRDQNHDFYVVSLNLIQREWDLSHTDRVRELLEGTRNSRYRGFEWDYYNRLAHREKATQTLPNGGSQITYTSDGKRLLVSGWLKAYLWDIKHGALVREFPGSGSPPARFAPDGKSVVTRDSNGAIRLWDTQTGKLRLELESDGLFAKNIGVNSFAFTPDSSQLIVSYNSHFYLFDLTSGKRIEELPDLEGAITFDLAPRGTQIVVATSDGLVVYDIPLFDYPTPMPKSRGASSVLFSPNSRFVLAGFGDGTARLRFRSGREIRFGYDTVKHQDFIRCLAFSPDGRFFATGSEDSTILLYEIRMLPSQTPGTTETMVAQVDHFKGHIDGVTSLSFSPDSRQLASVSSDGTLKVWGIVAPPPPTEARAEHNTAFSDVVQSSDGTLVVSRFNPITRQETQAPQVGQMKRVAIREVKSGKVLALLDGPEKSPFTCVAFSPDSRWLVTGHKEGHAALWDVRTGREVRRYSGHEATLREILFYPDGRRFLTYGDSKVMVLWETATGKKLHTFETQQSGFVIARLHKTMRRIVAANDHTVRFWDSNSFKLLLEIPQGSGPGGFINVETLVFSHDARYFVNNYYQCDIWDARVGKRLKTIHGQFIRAAGFSPDGKRLALVVKTRPYNVVSTTSLILWEVPSFQRLVSIAIPEYPSVWNLEFSADGKRIIGLDDNRQPIRSWQ